MAIRRTGLRLVHKSSRTNGTARAKSDCRTALIIPEILQGLEICSDVADSEWHRREDALAR
jgi:hypothetical protein